MSTEPHFAGDIISFTTGPVDRMARFTATFADGAPAECWSLPVIGWALVHPISDELQPLVIADDAAKPLHMYVKWHDFADIAKIEYRLEVI